MTPFLCCTDLRVTVRVSIAMASYLSMHVAGMQWAESLFKELDYRKEAANGIRFKELYGSLEVNN